jgi:hypothetical protein
MTHVFVNDVGPRGGLQNDSKTYKNIQEHTGHPLKPTGHPFVGNIQYIHQ